jgi:hypothetical protein
MKKIIVWTVALCFVFSFSLAYAAEKGSPVEPVVKDKGGASNPTEAPAGSPGEPSKTRKDAKKARAAKKKTKVKKSSTPVPSEDTVTSPSTLDIEKQK